MCLKNTNKNGPKIRFARLDVELEFGELVNAYTNALEQCRVAHARVALVMGPLQLVSTSDE